MLLPVDSAGRVLELLLLLDMHWTSARYSAPLILSVRFLSLVVSDSRLSHMGFNTIESSKGQLEWMSETVMKRFTSSRHNTFNFR